MSPLEVWMLLHYHAIVQPFPNECSPAQQRAIEKFCSSGLICKDEGSEFYRTTDRGKYLVESILNTAGALYHMMELAPV
jgi:hypothetical protein